MQSTVGNKVNLRKNGRSYGNIDIDFNESLDSWQKNTE